MMISEAQFSLQSHPYQLHEKSPQRSALVKPVAPLRATVFREVVRTSVNRSSVVSASLADVANTSSSSAHRFIFFSALCAMRRRIDTFASYAIIILC